MIDFFLPYLPLERPHIRLLFDMRLRDEAQVLRRRHQCLLQWSALELDFLVSKVCAMLNAEASRSIIARQLLLLLPRHILFELSASSLDEAPDTLVAACSKARSTVTHTVP